MATHIVFVCTGNTCRSQMAEALARAMIAQHDWPITCGSAGIRATPAEPTTLEARQVLQEHGLAWQGMSKPLTLATLQGADEVWLMTREHLAYAETLLADLPAPGLPRLSLLADTEVPDPLGCGRDAYMALYQFLQDCLPKRLQALIDEPRA